MDVGLTGRACIVTGASRGIGLALARSLAAEGAHVLLAARGAEELAGAAEECRRAAGNTGAEIAQLVGDVTRRDAGEQLVSRCESLFGRVDVVVNNAGTSWARPIDELSDEEWQQQWEIRVMGPMRVMRAAVSRMAAQGYGRIVNVSSAAGKAPSQTNVAYSVASAAQLSLSRAYADAYAARGVHVNAVAPGPVATAMWMAEGGLADQIAARQGVSREEVLAWSRSRAPLGRYATEEEIAAVVVFLCSERASYVTGAAWSVDGGFVPVIL